MRREAAKLDQAGLLRVERQDERLKPCTHHFEKPTRVGLALEPNHYIISISRDDHVAGGLAPSPALRPEIKDVVQIDVGEQWLDHRSLSRTPVTRRHDPIFEHSRLEPFLYQADDAPIADPVFQKTHQPFLTDRIKEALNVGERAEASFSRVEPGAKRMENAAARMGHGESAIRHHIRGQVQVGVTKPAFTRKS